MKNATQKLAAIVTSGILLAGNTEAHASTTNFSTISGNIVNSSGALPNLISTVAYVGGIGLGVAGIFKLKQHVDNPGQHPMKDGLVRLGAGGGLLALPFMTDAMTNTVSGGSAATGPSVGQLQFGAASFAAP